MFRARRRRIIDTTILPERLSLGHQHPGIVSHYTRAAYYVFPSDVDAKWTCSPNARGVSSRPPSCVRVRRPTAIAAALSRERSCDLRPFPPNRVLRKKPTRVFCSSGCICVRDVWTLYNICSRERISRKKTENRFVGFRILIKKTARAFLIDEIEKENNEFEGIGNALFVRLER